MLQKCYSLAAGLMQSCASLGSRLLGSITGLIMSVYVLLGTPLFMIGVRIQPIAGVIVRWVSRLFRTPYVQLKGILKAVIIRLQRRR